VYQHIVRETAIGFIHSPVRTGLSNLLAHHASAAS